MLNQSTRRITLALAVTAAAATACAKTGNGPTMKDAARTAAGPQTPTNNGVGQLDSARPAATRGADTLHPSSSHPR